MSGSLALSSPGAAGGWVAEELLEAARWCVFCGNRFVRVL